MFQACAHPPPLNPQVSGDLGSGLRESQELLVEAAVSAEAAPGGWALVAPSGAGHPLFSVLRGHSSKFVSDSKYSSGL